MKDLLHPGRIVHRAITKGLGLSITSAASRLKISRTHLSSIVNERASITPEMSIRLEKGIGGTAEMWLRMQLNFDLAQALGTAEETKIKKMNDLRRLKERKRE